MPYCSIFNGLSLALGDDLEGWDRGRRGRLRREGIYIRLSIKLNKIYIYVCTYIYIYVNYD